MYPFAKSWVIVTVVMYLTACSGRRNGIEQLILRVFHIEAISEFKCSIYNPWLTYPTLLWVFCQKQFSFFGQNGQFFGPLFPCMGLHQDYICISLWNLPKEERSNSQQVGGEDARVLNLTSLHQVGLHKSNLANIDCTADITRSLRTCLHTPLPHNFYLFLSPTFTHQL